ncbi:methyltransferase domain-containing protein [Mycoplasmopsis caviae]|uniref:Tellurite resistance protein TehB n=1 Tax=Mycoplasmopsis caviae TaxID=55603 RepID=A0A3P8KDH2_9BACT|nr:methyltransferase domain-containing protein [Mycoplasmopsis caviae]VDR42574.1 tellurite resistance protein TehB [Mycoplasmopsis caviae]
MEKINIGNVISSSIGFLLSPILSFVLYKYLPFYFLCIINIITYIISGILYWKIKINNNYFEFNKSIGKNNLNKNSKSSSLIIWTFVLSTSFVLLFFLYPKQSGLIQFFKYTNEYSYNDWAFIFTLIMSISGVVGSILAHFINKKQKLKKYYFISSIFGIAILNISWLFMPLARNNLATLVFYIVINAINQILFNLLLPMIYSASFKLFKKETFHKQNGISLVFRIVVSSLISILLTFINNISSYYFTYLTYTCISLLAAIIIVICYKKLFITNKQKYEIDNYYNNEKIFAEYIEYAKKGLWNSEKEILENILTNKQDKIDILDIGCGAGRTTLLAKIFKNASIDAVDINHKFINYCNEVNDNKNLKNISQENIDIDKKYDLILFSLMALQILFQKSLQYN